MGDMTNKIRIECPDDEKLMAAVGRMACASAHYDDALIMTINSLLKLRPEQARVIFARTGSAQLKQRVEAFADELCAPATAAKLKTLVQEGYDHVLRRHEVAHGLLGRDEEGNPIHFIKRQNKQEFVSPPDPAELNFKAERLIAIAQEITTIRLSLRSKEPTYEDLADLAGSLG